jgi:hypothetical protein
MENRSNGQVDVDRRLVWEGTLRKVGGNGIEGLVGEKQTQPRAAHREQQGLSEQLADDPAAAGSDCGADGEFVFAGCGGRQQKNRDIAAADEEQQGDGAEEQVERAAQLLHEIVVDAADTKPQFLRRKVSGGFLGELLNQRLQGGVSLGMAYTRLETNFSEISENLILGDLQREVDIAVVPRKARKGYADDGVGFVEQLQCLAHDGRVGVEVPLPELVAEHHYRLRVLAVDRVRGLQAAAERGWNSQELEHVRAASGRQHVFGQVATRNSHAAARRDKGVFHYRRLADYLPLRGGEKGVASHLTNGAEQARMNHAVDRKIRKGIQQDRIDDAEYSCRAAVESRIS